MRGSSPRMTGCELTRLFFSDAANSSRCSAPLPRRGRARRARSRARKFRVSVVDLATKHRLPSISMAREFAELGGLMAYGASLTDLQRRGATYVDKILKGAKPADLPVEQPTKFEFVINLKTAKALGLTIAESFQLLADEVIE
jgi:ABC transporter substrate binding protein